MRQDGCFKTTIRLDLNDDVERQACQYLKRLDKRRYKSYSRAIAVAVVDYFERQAKIANDPYLETREKEDAFLRRVQETIERGLQATPSIQNIQPPSVPASDDEEDTDAALDFINGF